MESVIDLTISLSPVLIFFVFICLISRYSPVVDVWISRRASVFLQKAAKWISWISAFAVLFVAIFGILNIHEINIGNGLVGCIGLAQIILMIAKRYKVAYRFAAIGLFVCAFAGFGYLYAPRDGAGSHMPPLAIDFGSVGFWILLLVGFVLVTSAWICLKSARDFGK